MFDYVIGTQPFDDGYIVEKKLGGGSGWCDYLMKHCVDGSELTLRVSINQRENMSAIDVQYEKAASLNEELLSGCLKQKLDCHDGEDYCLVQMYRNIDAKDMPVAAVTRMGIDICRALVTLQSEGYIHRNVKPVNISFAEGQYHLNSFDLMEELSSCDEEYVVGTPAFMAPEAMDGKCDMSTDVYSLGLTMYTLLNENRPPFVCAEISAKQAMRLRMDGSELPSIKGINPKMMGIVLKACAFKSSDRFGCAADMLEALNNYKTGSNSDPVQIDFYSDALMRSDEFSSRWKINSVLGSGSYGVVFDVTDLRNNARRALKVIHISEQDDCCAGIHMTESQRKTNYENKLSKASQEALVWTSISSSKNIVKLYESGRIDDPEDKYGCYFYMCSELLSPIENDIRDEKKAAGIAADVCAALMVVHKSNITHRDIKPENILYSPSDGYKLGDFGIAKLHRFKADGTVIGTVPYMPPEILKNYFDDQRRSQYDNTVDVYSLGLTLYTLLNRNRGPFIDCSPDEITDADIRHDNVCRAKGLSFPNAEFASDGLMRIINKACAYEPSDRYVCAADMHEALIDFLSD